MILGKLSLALLVHVLHFLHVSCDDVTFVSTTTIVALTEPNHDPESTENLDSTILPNFTNQDHGLTDSSSATRSSTSTYKPTTDDRYSSTVGKNPGGSKTTSSSTTHPSTQTTETTLPNYTTTTTVDSTTVDDSLCDSWPINASESAREVIYLRNDTGVQWIALSWEPPCAVPANVSITYSIERCDREENCKWINETDARHNATDLDACTQYTFTVKIITDYWESDGVGLQATTDNTILEIGEVRYLNVSAVELNSIQLTWLEPEEHAKCISNYSILQCSGQSCNETVVLVANYTANDLEPCTQYNFTVKTVASTVESVGVNTSATTGSPIPPEPQSMQIIPSNFSLTVEWEPPQADLTCLKEYHVAVTPLDANFTTTNTSLTIPKLYSCVEYTVNVSAVNKDNQNGPAFSKKMRTDPIKVQAPVLYDWEMGFVDSVEITVNINRDDNRCLLVTLMTMCNFTSTNGTGIEPSNGVSSKNLTSYNDDSSVIVLNTTVGNLSPFSEYSCKAYIVSECGFRSDNSNEIPAHTKQDVPSEPANFCLEKISESQINLTWSPPHVVPGFVEDYEIFLNWTSLFLIPDWCASETPNSDKIADLNDTLTYEYRKIKAYREYQIQIRAKTAKQEWGNYSEPLRYRSLPAVSGNVSGLSCRFQESPQDKNILDTILTWNIPCSLNGELEYFNVSVHGTRNESDHTFFRLEECADYVKNDYTCTVNLRELRGEYNYSFSVSPKILHVDTLGPATSESVIYPAGIPPQPSEEYVKSIIIDPFTASRTTTTATVFLPLFLDTNGVVKYYAIMVSESGYNNATHTRFDLKSNHWPRVPSWKDAVLDDFSIAYQTTPSKWNPADYITDFGGTMRFVKFAIGTDNFCKNISSNNKSQAYCNGPLKPDTWYHVRMRAFTEGGYSDCETLFVIRTKAEVNIPVIIGAVFGIFFVGILATMMLLVRKCSPHLVLRRFLHSDMPGSPVPAPFNRKKFIAHCQQLVDNPGKLSNEFRLLQTLSVDLQMPTNSACLQANRKKNRYSDILPYDFSRVKLDVIDNDPNTDYINASFIRGYAGEDEYIACQGPKEETTYDFWRMVDQYNVNIIVMLTQLIEKGKEKCHQYYPTIRETFQYETMTLRCTSELDFRTYTQRTFVLQKLQENKKRSIIQLHFKDWPDHDVPEDFDPMINFCQIIRRNISASNGLVVVHCSAGIGRTGTLIAIDILLQHLRDNRKLDVFGTVYRLRHQRINMVQRESQYAYIYNCIKQVLKNPYFLKTYKPPPVNPVYENVPKKPKDTTNTDTNLVSSVEILKRHNNSVSMDSLETMHNLFPWSNERQQGSIISNGLRQYKSMETLDQKSHHSILEKARTVESIIHKSLNFKDLIYKNVSSQSLQESYPLLTCSNSADAFSDSSQCATEYL